MNKDSVHRRVTAQKVLRCLLNTSNSAALLLLTNSNTRRRRVFLRQPHLPKPLKQQKTQLAVRLSSHRGTVASSTCEEKENAFTSDCQVMMIFNKVLEKRKFHQLSHKFVTYFTKKPIFLSMRGFSRILLSSFYLKLTQNFQLPITLLNSRFCAFKESYPDSFLWHHCRSYLQDEDIWHNEEKGYNEVTMRLVGV